MRIISQAPTRLSLFGGGTDVNPYASTYGGVVFNMAINIRQHIELTDSSNEWIMPQLAVSEFYIPFFEKFKVHTLLGMKATSDSVIESGLGSSASAAVALIGALAKFKKVKLSKQEIAEMAWDIEVNKLGMYSGKQDQYAAVYGGVNVMEFKENVTVTQLSPAFVDFMIPYMILFHTGSNRKSGKIQEGFKELSDDQIVALDEIKKVTFEGLDAISNKDIDRVGRLLDFMWDLKKKSNKGVSNDKIDKIYTKGISSGAYGGKILGAGGGGHIIFLCPPIKQNKLKENMLKMGCVWKDFSIDWNGLETRIL